MKKPSPIDQRWLRWLFTLALLIGLWVFSASPANRRILGCPSGCAKSSQTQQDAVRIFSLNMLHGFPHFENLDARLAYIAQEIRRQQADIVLLQEAPWTLQTGFAAEHLAQQAGLNHLYLRANGNRWSILFEEGEAILSRFPLTAADFIELKPQAGFFERRVVLKATALTPWGDLTLFVTHLTNGDARINAAQAQALQAFVAASQAEIAIISGDFNAQPDSPQIQSLAWIDVYRSLHPDAPGLTCCIAGLTRGPDEPLEKRIDYIFLAAQSKPPEILDSQVILNRPTPFAQGWLWASDHLGLLTTIRLP